jgi:hypothetical protein
MPPRTACAPYRLKDGYEVAGRGIDDLQDLGGCRLLGNGFVTLGSALGKLASQFVNDTLGISRVTVRSRVHRQTFCGACYGSIIR